MSLNLWNFCFQQIFQYFVFIVDVQYQLSTGLTDVFYWFIFFFLFSVAVIQKNSTHDKKLWFKAQALVANPDSIASDIVRKPLPSDMLSLFIFRSSSGSWFPMRLMLWIRSACCLWPMTMHWPPTKSWPSKLRYALLSEWDIWVARFIPHW